MAKIEKKAVESRRDWAVVLARGASRRMGRPKGLCCVDGDRISMVERIAVLYAELGWPLALVTTPDLKPAYAEVLPTAAVSRWILAPPGGGTAATVAAALAVLKKEASHLWLHPVDLPGVAVATLVALQELSCAVARTVLVPEYAGTPGHPVVIPAGPLGDLVDPQAAGSMRECLRAVCGSAPGQVSLRTVPVADPGTIHDYDSPSDLARENHEHPTADG